MRGYIEVEWRQKIKAERKYTIGSIYGASCDARAQPYSRIFATVSRSPPTPLPNFEAQPVGSIPPLRLF